MWPQQPTGLQMVLVLDEDVEQNAQNVYVSIFIPNDSIVELNCDIHYLISSRIWIHIFRSVQELILRFHAG